jgi:hypothetical protein
MPQYQKLSTHQSNELRPELLEGILNQSVVCVSSFPQVPES